LLDAARPRKALLPAMGAMKALLTASEPIARTAMITMALRIFPTHEAAAARIDELRFRGSANGRCKTFGVPLMWGDRFLNFDQLNSC
jgi:hypothetical protein